MNASKLHWWLNLVPWWCVACGSEVRRRMKPASCVFVWTNFLGDYLLERGQRLSGDWDACEHGGECFRFMPGVVSDIPNVDYESPQAAAPYVHELTEQQMQRVIRRYHLQLVGSGWNAKRLQQFQRWGISIEEEEDS